MFAVGSNGRQYLHCLVSQHCRLIFETGIHDIIGVAGKGIYPFFLTFAHSVPHSQGVFRRRGSVIIVAHQPSHPAQLIFGESVLQIVLRIKKNAANPAFVRISLAYQRIERMKAFDYAHAARFHVYSAPLIRASLRYKIKFGNINRFAAAQALKHMMQAVKVKTLYRFVIRLAVRTQRSVFPVFIKVVK